MTRHMDSLYTKAIIIQPILIFHSTPQFQEILKPNYNSVDLAEVELVDTYMAEPRGNDTQLLAVSLNFKEEKKSTHKYSWDDY